ncbi:hypothetical protein [Priestia abyssalis]
MGKWILLAGVLLAGSAVSLQASINGTLGKKSVQLKGHLSLLPLEHWLY